MVIGQLESERGASGTLLFAEKCKYSTLKKNIGVVRLDENEGLKSLTYSPRLKLGALRRFLDKQFVALGAFYRPDRKSLISVSGTLGSNDNMLGVGFSRTLGEGVEVNTANDEKIASMQIEISNLREENAANKSALSIMQDKIKELTEIIKSLIH